MCMVLSLSCLALRMDMCHRLLFSITIDKDVLEVYRYLKRSKHYYHAIATNMSTNPGWLRMIPRFSTNFQDLIAI